MVAKRFLEGTHRAAHPAETLALIGPKLRDIGVTRVANVTGLDVIGIPVVMAVRPGSRTLSVQQGKGITHEVALVSGLMEAFETACAETIPSERFEAPVSKLHVSERLVPPQTLATALPSDASIPWWPMRNLFEGRERWVPAELVFADFTWPPPPGQGYFHPTSNGLASGNNREEALLHALCEVIERDCLALWAVRARYRRTAPFRLSSVPDPLVQLVLAALDRAGMRVSVWDIGTEIEVPCFLATIDDGDSPRPPYLGSFSGSGCHPSAGVAIARALLEAVQSRLTVIAGSRDDLRARRYDGAGDHGNLLSALGEDAPPRSPATFEDRSIATDTLDGDLAEVTRGLASAGILEVFTTPLPSLVPGLHCARVVAPELEPLCSTAHYRPGKRARAAQRRWSLR